MCVGVCVCVCVGGGLWAEQTERRWPWTVARVWESEWRMETCHFLSAPAVI